MEEEIEESAGRKERTSTVTIGGERDESNEKEEEEETPSRAIGKNIRGAVRHNTGRGQQFKIAA